MFAVFLVFYLAGTTPSPVILQQFVGEDAMKTCETVRERVRTPKNAVMRCVEGNLKPNT